MIYFYFFDAVVLIGLFNAFVFGGVIFLKKPNSTSNHLLTVVLLVLGLLCAKILLHTLGLWQTPLFRYFPLGIDLWLPPLLWLYVIALTEPQKLQKSLIKTHLAVPVLFFGYSLVVYVGTVFVKNLDRKTIIAHQLFYNEIKISEDILSVLLGVFYGGLAYQQIHKYQYWVTTYLSNTAIPTYNWLRNLLLVTGFILILLGLMLASQQFYDVSVVPLQLFYFYLVFLIYVFGFFGFRHQEFKISIDLITKKTDAVSNIQQTDLLKELAEWMKTEKPYLEPNLNLNQCAERLNCTSQALSEAINLIKNQNFRDYINNLRVEEFKHRITQVNLQKETIMGIAYDCGFNSEASFYRIFKEKTGKSPKEFLSK